MAPEWPDCCLPNAIQLALTGAALMGAGVATFACLRLPIEDVVRSALEGLVNLLQEMAREK